MSQVRPTEELTFTVDGRSYDAGIDYDPRTGQSTVKAKGLFGSTVGTPFIINPRGEITPWGKERLSTEEQNQFIRVTKESIRQAYESAGGNSNKAVLPGWIKTEDENFNAADAAHLNDKSHHFPPDGGSNNKDNKDNFENLGTALSPITGNVIKELMCNSGGYLNYPSDAIYTGTNTGYNQDHVRITQYTYKPPRASMVKTEKGDKSKNAITLGSKRTSPLKDYLGMVKLPMPSDVSDANNVSWGEDTMNNISAALTGFVGANMGKSAGAKIAGGVLNALTGWGSGDAAVTGLIGADAIAGGGLADLFQGAAGETIKSTLQSRILSGQGVNVSPESILARGLGVVPNANLELLFKSPTLREFQFNWKMTPRSREEAKTVRNIIRFFKQGMAARKLSGKAGMRSLWLGTPNVFHVQYKTNEELDIEGVNKIKTCAVTGCAINYTPDGVWSAYEDGQPTSTVMTLRMQELEPVYDTDYTTNVMKDKLFNDDIRDGGKVGGGLYKVGLNEVGY